MQSTVEGVKTELKPLVKHQLKLLRLNQAPTKNHLLTQLNLSVKNQLLHLKRQPPTKGLTRLENKAMEIQVILSQQSLQRVDTHTTRKEPSRIAVTKVKMKVKETGGVVTHPEMTIIVQLTMMMTKTKKMRKKKRKTIWTITSSLVWGSRKHPTQQRCPPWLRRVLTA